MAKPAGAGTGGNLSGFMSQPDSLEESALPVSSPRLIPSWCMISGGEFSVSRPPSSAAPLLQAVTAVSWGPGGTCPVMRRAAAACVCPTWWAPSAISAPPTTGSWPVAGAVSRVPATHTTPSAPSATRYAVGVAPWAPEQERGPHTSASIPLHAALPGLSKVRLGCSCPQPL